MDHHFKLSDAIYMPFISFGMNDIHLFIEIKNKIFENDRLSMKKLQTYFDIQINYFNREDG